MSRLLFPPRIQRIRKGRLNARGQISIIYSHKRDAGMHPAGKMERVVQPTKATRWFGAMLLGSAIAAMMVILLSAFVQSRMMSVEPEIRQHVASQEQSRQVERPPIVVTIEPSRIMVIGRRSVSVFDTLADWLPRRGDAS
jgi:hypothetical protein